MALHTFLNQYPLISLIIVALASLLIMFKSGDMLLFGITKWSKKLGLSDYLIGLFVVGLTASLPELFSGLSGLVMKDSGIVFGTIFGSNIVGFTLLLGVIPLIGKKVSLKSELFSTSKKYIFILVALPFILVFIGNKLTRIDGLILVSSYFAYFMYLWKKEQKETSIKKDIQVKKIWKFGLIFILALGALLLSARWLIFSSLGIAQRLQIPSFIIGLVVLGIGSQVPDLITIIKSELQGHKDIGLGDIIGGTLVKALLFLGILALIQPLEIDFSLILITAVASLITLSLLLYYMYRTYITRKDGILLVILYIAFIVLSFVF